VISGGPVTPPSCQLGPTNINLGQSHRSGLERFCYHARLRVKPYEEKFMLHLTSPSHNPDKCPCVALDRRDRVVGMASTTTDKSPTKLMSGNTTPPSVSPHCPEWMWVSSVSNVPALINPHQAATAQELASHADRGPGSLGRCYEKRGRASQLAVGPVLAGPPSAGRPAQAPRAASGRQSSEKS